MPYILPEQRALELANNQNILESCAEYLRKEPNDNAKANAARDFLAYLIDMVYGEECFSHSKSMAQNLDSTLNMFGNLLCANVAAIEQQSGGREGLLNYAMTRFFNELYPAARYKDYNSVAGIIASLSMMAHPGNIPLLGLLSCCKDEYYRKYAAPYEDEKERENGAVSRRTLRPESY